MSTFDSARKFLRRVFVTDDDSIPQGSEEPRAALPSLPGPLGQHSMGEPEPEAEFTDLLDGLGVEPIEGEPIDLRDAELAELRGMLAQLQPMGEELAATEKERLRLEQRCQELERALEEQHDELEALRAAKDPDSSRRETQLAKRLEQREQVLERERERSALARRQRDDRNRVASERWRELQALKSRLRVLEKGDTPAT